MEERDIKNLLDKYRAGTASEDEIALLESWYLHFTAQDPEVLTEEERLDTFNQVWANLENEQDAKKTRRLWPRIAAAASILIGLCVGGYFILHKSQPPQLAQNQINDVLPGTNHAILKTGNKTIQLDNHANGLLAAQGSTIINKTDSGSIAYQGKSTSEMVYDTLVVPAGAKPYRLTLADGSKLLVNVASKIRFPENFSKNERRIDMLSGEAYFEVNHDIARPLSVYVKGQIVKDLGTHFNISAYDDETTTSTTLIQGSLSVSNGNQTKVLIPGQQAITGQQIKIIKDADLDQIMAWKDGMFKFDSTPLVDIMKQVSRWYDVEVVYKDEALKAKTFFAVSTRFAKVSTLLGNLEKIGGVKFKIDGKKIIVMNP